MGLYVFMACRLSLTCTFLYVFSLLICMIILATMLHCLTIAVHVIIYWDTTETSLTIAAAAQIAKMTQYLVDSVQRHQQQAQRKSACARPPRQQGLMGSSVVCAIFAMSDAVCVAVVVKTGWNDGVAAEARPWVPLWQCHQAERQQLSCRVQR
jgi:hypothetical protein